MAITKASSNAVAPAAKGDLIAGTTTNDSGVLAVGANGTVLTAASGQATGLEWATPSSGGMTLLSTTTLSGATTTLSSIPQTYNTLYVVIRNPLPANDGADLLFRFNADATASRHNKLTTVGGGTGGFGDTSIRLTENNDNSVNQSMIVLTFPDYTNTTTWKNADIFGLGNDSTTTTNFRQVWVKGTYNQTAAITSLSFFLSSGNFTSGSILLYGVK